MYFLILSGEMKASIFSVSKSIPRNDNLYLGLPVYHLPVGHLIYYTLLEKLKYPTWIHQNSSQSNKNQLDNGKHFTPYMCSKAQLMAVEMVSKILYEDPPPVVKHLSK